MEKTKVLHIITRLISGGADENTVFTCEGLDPERYEVHLVVGGQSELVIFPEIKNTKIIRLDSLVRNIHPLKDFQTFTLLVRLMRREHYHIVHTHTAKAGILGRAAARWVRSSIIIHSLHGSTFHDSVGKISWFFYKTLEKITARWTKKIISVGNDLRDRYLAAGVGKPEQYVTIRSGFDLSQFSLDDAQMLRFRKALLNELSLDQKTIIIGSACRLETRKGHIYLLEAAKKIIPQHKNVHFVFAGDGVMEAELKTQASAMGLSGHIHFLGFRNDIQNVMAGFDIFALTSLWEGLPRVLVQAAVLQRPIITFDIEGAAEIVEPGKNGYIVPKKDVSALSTLLLKMIADMPTTRAMGESGKSKISGDWDKDVMVAKITQLYEDLLSAEEQNIQHTL